MSKKTETTPADSTRTMKWGAKQCSKSTAAEVNYTNAMLLEQDKPALGADDLLFKYIENADLSALGQAITNGIKTVIQDAVANGSVPTVEMLEGLDLFVAGLENGTIHPLSVEMQCEGKRAQAGILSFPEGKEGKELRDLYTNKRGESTEVAAAKAIPTF